MSSTLELLGLTPLFSSICALWYSSEHNDAGANGGMIGDEWQIGLRDDMAEQIPPFYIFECLPLFAFPPSTLDGNV